MTRSHTRIAGVTLEQDWESIYRDNVDRIYRLVYSRVGNRPDAEDLTSEVFKAALPPLRLSASPSEIRSYLTVTAGSVLASHWKVRFGIEVTALDPEAEAACCDEPGDEVKAQQRVAKILSALPDHYRHVLELRFLQSMSLREAALAMGVSVGNAKVLQHRALRLAAQQMEEVQR